MERKEFFTKHYNFPWFDLPLIDTPEIPSDYALFDCHKVDQNFIEKLNTSSAEIGKIINRIPDFIRSLDDETLIQAGYPADTIKIIREDHTNPFAMRLDWCCQPNGEFKILEINSQTPSFWRECEEGNGALAKQFNLTNPTPNSTEQLKKSLNLQIEAHAKLLGKNPHDCNVTFVTLDILEDIETMRWLSQYCDYDATVIGAGELGIDENYALDLKNRKVIDIMLFWYPIEWALLDTDENGTPLWTKLQNLILNKKVAIVNYGVAFAIQVKGSFALLYEHGKKFFGDDFAIIEKYIPETRFEPFKSTYVKKPILGRQGEGVIIVEEGTESLVSGTDEYYFEQKNIYQELLEMPTIEYKPKDRVMTALYGAWLYSDGTKLVPGGIGIRLSQGKITNDYSYWLPIGV
jgi:glutathionylspermidine synthase